MTTRDVPLVFVNEDPESVRGTGSRKHRERERTLPKVACEACRRLKV